ncbi:MAG: HAMP domain-containing sensor histidine kinase [Steroidobacteraceae bacterium]
MPRQLLQSSAIRLALLYVGVFTIAVGALLGAVFLLAQRELVREVDQVIAAEIEGLRDDYENGGLQTLVETLRRRTDSWGRTGAVYLLVDASGNRVAGNLSSWPEARPGADPWIEFELAAREHGAEVSHPVRAAVYALDSHHLLVGTDVSERRAFAARLRDAMLWSTLLAALLSGLIGWWYSRRVGARVRAAAQACEQIISGDLARRLPVGRARDEFDQLATAVNHALDRVEQQALTVRATFSSAAHDLRSPLHRLRMRLESAVQRPGDGEDLREALGAALGELERVQRTLATLLQIARAAAGAPLSQAESVNLADMAHEIVELYAPAAREAGLALALHAPAACAVTGSRQLLAQLLANLLENALKFVPAGGAVEVSVLAGGEGGAVLSVVDNGPGIPEPQRAAALEPFRRLERDATQPGSGLGLSLVAAVMRLHRGHLVLGDRSPGLEVRCEFPPAPPPAARAA